MKTRSQTRNEQAGKSSNNNHSKSSSNTNTKPSNACRAAIAKSVKPDDRAYGICFDGTITNATGRGAGSHHGGIKQWVPKQQIPSYPTQTTTNYYYPSSRNQVVNSNEYLLNPGQQLFDRKNYQNECTKPTKQCLETNFYTQKPETNFQVVSKQQLVPFNSDKQMSNTIYQTPIPKQIVNVQHLNKNQAQQNELDLEIPKNEKQNLIKRKQYVQGLIQQAEKTLEQKNNMQQKIKMDMDQLQSMKNRYKTKKQYTKIQQPQINKMFDKPNKKQNKGVKKWVAKSKESVIQAQKKISQQVKLSKINKQIRPNNNDKTKKPVFISSQEYFKNKESKQQKSNQTNIFSKVLQFIIRIVKLIIYLITYPFCFSVPYFKSFFQYVKQKYNELKTHKQKKNYGDNNSKQSKNIQSLQTQKKIQIVNQLEQLIKNREKQYQMMMTRLHTMNYAFVDKETQEKRYQRQMHILKERHKLALNQVSLY